VTVRRSRYKSNYIVQFVMLLWRACIGNFRNKRVALVRYIQKCVMGVFVGLLYLQTPLDQKGVCARA
jgi:hypothetical protein